MGQSSEERARGASEKTIILPTASMRDAFYKMAQDYSDAGENRYCNETRRAGFDFLAYVSLQLGYARGIDLPYGLVPYTTYWLVDGAGDTIYGVSRLRHRLTDRSRREGGHIGYDVPPSLRGAGNATTLLSLTLAKARDMGILRALVTCNEDNRASARVIVKNGGTLYDQVVSDYSGKVVNRYWIYN